MQHDPLALTLSKPLAFYRRKLQVNWKEALFTLGKGAIDGGFESLSEKGSLKGVVSGIFEAAKEVGLGLTNEARAYSLIYLALKRVIEQYTSELWQKHKLPFNATAWESLGKKIEALLTEEKVTFDYHFFRDPKAFKPLIPVQLELRTWAEETEGLELDEALLNGIPALFKQ